VSIEKYQLTRTGALVARCLNRPFDTNLRDEVERIVYGVANRNPRPIILENDMPKLIALLVEAIECVIECK
jgi:hypothetical protein